MNNFDEIIDRKETSCLKWSYLNQIYGRDDLTSMWVADSDFKVPNEVIERIIKRAKHGIFGYTAKPQSFYDALINWVDKKHQFKIEQNWMVAVPGIVPAINWAILSLTGPGDKIIIQPPVYYPFFSSVTDNGRILLENTLIEEEGFYRMDYDGLEAMIDSDVKMLILCNPHNPVGRVYTEEELKRLGDICVKHNIIIVSDEIHCDLIHEGHKHIPIAGLSKEISNITLTCMAPSKTFNVAGLEASVAIIENEKIREKIKTFQKQIGLGMINIFGIEAFTACYEEGEPWLKEQLNYLKGNIDFFKSFIKKELPDFKISPIEGTYLLWLDCRYLNMPQKVLQDFFVNEVNVGLDQGEMFGKTGKGFMRFNLATPRSHIEKVLNNLKAAIDKKEAL